MKNEIYWYAVGKYKTGWVDWDGTLISADELAAQTNSLQPEDVMRLAKASECNLRLVSFNEAKGRLSHE
jgi:hypothetical protein